MKSSLIDIPVLLIYMARPKQFAQVFEQVKIARPSKLFLYQDGPREGRPNDIDNIAKCQSIAENIDWECEVYKNYQERNIGCDPSEYIAQKWMFNHVDRGIILEDDDVPSQSFFHFCKELLDFYYDDMRINHICGMNHLEIYENGTNDSYFFSSSGSISGWATWKRNVDLWDQELNFLSDTNALHLLKKNMGDKYFNFKIKTWRKHKDSGTAYYESILHTNELLNSQLNIIPTKNLISNIGITPDAIHTNDSKKMPARIQNIFFMKTYELDFPLKHPKFILNDLYYSDKILQIFGITDSVVMKILRKIRNRLGRMLNI